MASPGDREIAARLRRLASPRTEEGRALASKLASRLSQVAGAPAPAVERLAEASLGGRRVVVVDLVQEGKGTMLGPGCYAEALVLDGRVRTLARLPGFEEMFARAVVVATVFELLAARLAAEAETLAAAAGTSACEVLVERVESLKDLDLAWEGPPAPVLVGGELHLHARISSHQETG